MIAAFGEHLTKKGLLPELLQKTLLNLYQSRITSDYGVDDVPSSDDSREALEAARRFTKSVETYLQEWLAKSPEE